MVDMERTSLPGDRLVQLDIAVTVIALVAGVLGLVSGDLARFVLVPVAAVTGTVGVATFVWSYFRAVGRSRQDEISVSQLYGVAGTVAPRPVKRRLQWSLWAQVVAAVAVMFLGFERTGPQEFNWAATIIVLPLFGMGINGVWVSMHGTFGPRILAARPSRRARPTRPVGSSQGPSASVGEETDGKP